MENLTGLQRAAALLKSLGPELVEKILAKLESSQAKMLRAQMGRINSEGDARQILNTILPDIDAALGEAMAEIKAQEPPPPAPPPPPANTVEAKPPAPEPVKEPVAAPKVLPPKETRSFDPTSLPTDPTQAIRVLPPETLVQALQGEPPRTVAMVLNYLDNAQATEIFKRLPGDIRREVSVQYTGLTMPNMGVFRTILQALVNKASKKKETFTSPDQAARIQRMATFLRQIDRAERIEMLKALNEKDPNAAQAIKGLLYQFEDLLKLDTPSMQKLLGDLDAKTLGTAMKNASQDICDKILNNLSKRAQDNLKEELDLLGSVPSATVEAARKSILDSLQMLDERGELVMVD